MKICAVIAEETIREARTAIGKAATAADMIELRLDYLGDLDMADPIKLKALVAAHRLPTIVTFRAAREGGRKYVEDRARLSFLAAAQRWADYCDVEAECYDQAMRLGLDASRLIVSYHDFEGTPADIDQIYSRICSLPAAIHKIATTARQIEDSLAIFRLLERARVERRNLIALAMGEAGLMTRILGPSRGSLLTYGSVARGRESALGQVTCEELRGLYRVNQISRATAVAGIIGSPVEHSASPAMHNAAAAALGLNFVYFPIRVDDLSAFFEKFVRPSTRQMDWELCGLSVTIPHKSAVMPFLDEVDPVARAIGAVNTVVIKGDRLIGHNTDVEGAMQPLREIDLSGRGCAVLGAGGAARAIIYGLLGRGARVSVFARDIKRAGRLAEEFGVAVRAITELGSSDAEILINATPVGMRGWAEGQSPVPSPWLRGRKLVYDLVYNPLDTALLKCARAEGCRTIGGLEMLVAQAGLQFQMWTGLEPSASLMREAAINWLGP
jgi:3-dehydroquinate dehydratase/shikimate dehydrogenase